VLSIVRHTGARINRNTVSRGTVFPFSRADRKTHSTDSDECVDIKRAQYCGLRIVRNFVRYICRRCVTERRSCLRWKIKLISARNVLQHQSSSSSYPGHRIRRPRTTFIFRRTRMRYLYVYNNNNNNTPLLLFTASAIYARPDSTGIVCVRIIMYILY